MPISSQLARGLAPAGRRLLGMRQQRGRVLGMAAARYLASTAAAAAAVRLQSLNS